MSDRLKQLKKIVNQTGDKLVLLSEEGEGDVVMLSLDEYEYLIELAYGGDDMCCMHEEVEEAAVIMEEPQAFTPEIFVEDANRDICSWREDRIRAEYKEISEQRQEEHEEEERLAADAAIKQEPGLEVVPNESVEVEAESSDEEYLYETPIPSMPLRWEMTKKAYRNVPKKATQEGKAYEFTAPERRLDDVQPHVFLDEPI